MIKKEKAQAPQKIYKRLSDAFITKNLIDYYETNDFPFKTFCNERAISTECQSIWNITDKIDLFKMKEGFILFCTKKYYVLFK